MKVIDARTGRQLLVGSVVDGGGVIQQINPGHLTASATVALPDRRSLVQVPLTVRHTHPRFFLQHVAFFPS